MKKTFKILKEVNIIIGSIIGIISLVFILFIVGQLLYNYFEIKANQPFADIVVKEFINHYNNKDYNYIYDNLVDDEFKAITTKNESKKELQNIYKKHGKIVWKEKGYIESFLNNDYYFYDVTLYQKTEKEKFEMNYTFKFTKKLKDKKFKICGYRYKKQPVDKWDQPVND